MNENIMISLMQVKNIRIINLLASILHLPIQKIPIIIL
jgi:hypothetical protein